MSVSAVHTGHAHAPAHAGGKPAAAPAAPKMEHDGGGSPASAGKLNVKAERRCAAIGKGRKEVLLF